MAHFVWYMVISYQMLFFIVSSVIYVYLREQSFKYYALFNIFLAVYVLSRNDEVYYALESFFSRFLGAEKGVLFTDILSFYTQIVFYNFYSFFALHFLDVDKLIKKFFLKVVRILKFLALFFMGLAVFCFFIHNSDLYVYSYLFLYLPVMLIIFIFTVFKAMKYSSKHKYFFLSGVIIFVICALIALSGSFLPELNLKNPINFFFTGVALETIFFSLGLAYKMKLLNDERIRVQGEIIKHRHRQQITKLHALLEGEEKERKRLAQELHDGIAGDLTAVKYMISSVNLQNDPGRNSQTLAEINQIILRFGEQIREISHNLSLSSITNLGLITALENFCQKIERLYGIQMQFKFSGNDLALDKVIETHIYRIIQELVNNMVKHSQADQGEVSIIYEYPDLTIKVDDNGKGFDEIQKLPGIGLSNIESRIRFMNAYFRREDKVKGTTFIIKIDLRKVPNLRRSERN